jgi:hypothetical protein
MVQPVVALCQGISVESGSSDESRDRSSGGSRSDGRRSGGLDLGTGFPTWNGPVCLIQDVRSHVAIVELVPHHKLLGPVFAPMRRGSLRGQLGHSCDDCRTVSWLGSGSFG